MVWAWVWVWGREVERSLGTFDPSSSWDMGEQGQLLRQFFMVVLVAQVTLSLANSVRGSITFIE